MATITIPGKTRKSIDIELVGTEYTVRPPKASVAVFLSQALKDAGEDAEKLLDGLEKWNLVLFGKEIGPKVTERPGLEDRPHLPLAAARDGLGPPGPPLRRGGRRALGH